MVYTSIELVIGALVQAGLIRVIATLRPVFTYKTAKCVAEQSVLRQGAARAGLMASCEEPTRRAPWPSGAFRLWGRSLRIRSESLWICE